MKRKYVKPHTCFIITDDLMDGFRVNQSEGGDPSMGRAKNDGGFADEADEPNDPFGDAQQWGKRNLWDD